MCNFRRVPGLPQPIWNLCQFHCIWRGLSILLIHIGVLAEPEGGVVSHVGGIAPPSLGEPRLLTKSVCSLEFSFDMQATAHDRHDLLSSPRLPSLGQPLYCQDCNRQHIGLDLPSLELRRGSPGLPVVSPLAKARLHLLGIELPTYLSAARLPRHPRLA